MLRFARQRPKFRRLAAGVAVALCWSTVAVPQSAAAAEDVTDGLVLRYDLDQTSGSVVVDSSGNGRDGTLAGGTWSGAGGLGLDGVDDHVKIPNNVIAGLSSITVSVDVLVDPAQATPYFIWGLGNPATSSTGNGYLFAGGDAFRAAASKTNWSGEQVTARSSGGRLERGAWKSVTYTQTGTTGTLYEDGVAVGRNTAVTVQPGQIGNGTTTVNVLGESNYAADNTLRGKVKNFRIYNRALTDAEVATIALGDAERVRHDAADLALGDLSAVTADLALPGKAAYGSTVTWASDNPAVIAADGKVTRPAPDAEPVAVTLTATLSRGDSTTQKAFRATVPPLPGDRSRAEEAASALNVVHADDVRGHLTLPTTGLNNASVTWSSSAPSVVAPDGVVTRPANDAGDTAVRLTATVTAGTATVTRTFDLTVRRLPKAEPYAGYAFAYFTGNSVAGEKIYFAASRGNNALQWDELNNGAPVLTSTKGTQGLRDPFLIRSPEGDRFFLIATDLSIGRDGNWDRAQRQGSLYLEVWESTDLITWSEQRHVKISPPTAGNTWAPEAYWDDTTKQYVVFWASKLYAENDPQHTGNTYNRMLYATTRDFTTFSEPKIWQDRGSSRIDSTVIKDDGLYYRFTKDEGAGGTGCSDIIQEKATSLTAVDLPGAPAWAFQQGCIGRDAGTSAVEGPTVFKANPGDKSGYPYYLFVDEYGGRGYIPLGTTSLDAPQWRVPPAFDLPAGPRHGTVVPVTAAEHTALLKALGGPVPPEPVKRDANGLVAHYPLDQTSGTQATDTSGNGHHGTLSGDTSWADGALRLGGGNGHVRLPDDIMAGLDEITVSLDVDIDPGQATPYFIWGLGNSSGSAGDGYLFTTGDDYRSSISTGNWTGEQTVTSGSAVPRGGWRNLTYTLDRSDTAKVYLDGVLVGTRTGVTVDPGDIGGGRTTANYLGRSLYSADKYLKGQVRDFSLYAKALSAEEVATLSGNTTGIIGVRLDSLKVDPRIDPAAGTVVLPVRPGTGLKALAPQFVVASGSTVAPTGPRDYSKPVTVTVTAKDGTARQWAVRAVPMRSPVLPGFNADPNVVRFGDTYYIYATTDGFPGWSSSSFKVWSSKNLVDWTEHGTILDLGPDVSWAESRAWAPTAIEKDGKYYFYFSADQNIGVAVADSPLGPFTEPLGRPLVDKADYGNAQQIDPAVFTDDDGRSYLLWGNGTPHVAQLNPDMVSLDKSTEKTPSGLKDFREGLFLNKRAGVYYLSWSIDDTRSENYRVGYATGPSPTGPWTSRGEILTKDTGNGILGTGHHSIVQVPGTDDWYIAYHRFAIPGGDGTHRETTIDRLHFEADGSIRKVVPTLESVEPLTYTGGPITTAVSLGTVTLTGGPGVAAIEHRVDGGAWTKYQGPITVGKGRHTVEYRAQGVNLIWSEVRALAVEPLTYPQAKAEIARFERAGRITPIVALLAQLHLTLAETALVAGLPQVASPALDNLDRLSKHVRDEEVRARLRTIAAELKYQI
ncbi:family 43 glycosylhydrolase [Saccharothrix sp. S26]|uniref:family 43 glycosylhydrolase n=1 Tax=Saccharothrix sp. S26 TaxID=2907215 RepID=UPI001F24CEB5|nr:family 43 glycosylhydrolase [Saccharothrix sp. S26]MCE6997345.1 family 43 glycosylhydrolase [Saccharothrix sp. S26]